jgi:predicted esterase
LSAEQKAALAISGWLLGANGASENLAVAVSLVQVRSAVRAYLREPLAHKRVELLDSMRSLEGATVEKVARLLRWMAPPWDIDKISAHGYGFYEMIAPGRSEAGNFRYLVQLPPEYDPSRRYPAVITLCGTNQTPRMSLDFWAGSQSRNQAGEVTGPRRGQAMRHGYITIAVEWLEPHQYRYGFSLREHTAVLTCLRDACRRLSIDTDRVFLSGYDIGGEAAWDMAQSHPDLWAGAIPISARSDKYDKFYWENGKFVPFYFVFGELDGKIMSHNGSLLNIYLKRRFDTTVVEYLGRGHETFHDEILHLFDWMGRKQRSGAPDEFACKTLRPWDNFYWWIECGPFPDQWMMYPEAWQKRDAKPTLISGRIPKSLKQPRSNRLMARTTSLSTTVWLSPELVDFDKPITVTLNGKKLTRSSNAVRPDLEVLLEDVRTRADRLHPFWAKLESP